MFAHVAVLLTLGVVLTVGLVVGAWFVFGQPGSAGDRLSMVKTVLAVVGGVGGVVALTVVYRKHRAVGHDKPSVRVAGVYALAELADDWAAGRQLCVDVLCAYVRLPAGSQEGEREVRRTLFRVVRDHLRPEEEWSRVKWSGCKFSFEGATIEVGDLSYCVLTEGGRMSFHGVQFTDGFNMHRFTLRGGAQLWFTWVPQIRVLTSPRIGGVTWANMWLPGDKACH
jgi:hypothetical protein